MLSTTVGQLLIRRALGGAAYDGGPLDKKGVQALFDRLAHERPDEYRDVAHALTRVGREAAFATGGFSFGLRHMLPTAAGEAARREIEAEVDAVRRRGDLDARGRAAAIVAVLRAHQKPLEDAVFAESAAEGNPLAHQVANVGRGNRASLKALRAGDLLYTDHRDREIPMPALEPYSAGLSPASYWAAGFGARQGVFSTKFMTAQAGYLAKQINQAVHRLVVVDRDDPEPPTANVRGLPVAASDPGNVGALLAHEAAGHPRNTGLTRAVLGHIRGRGVDRILVRSPIVGGPESGVYARDVGVRERNSLAPRGDFVGIAAGQALAEKITQMQLSAKHSGGVAGAGPQTSGFAYINSLMQIPKTFPGGAVHAEVDGHVGSVTPAPQGGSYVSVDGRAHYVPAELDVTVRPGDAVEAGDVVSGGIPNPAALVEHKGIGEGSRRFVEAFAKAYRDSGANAHRRNVELLARGLIDHVELDEELGDHAPGDVVSYRALERAWEPRPGHERVPPRYAVGRYLEEPVLHHSIGTKVRKSMVDDLERFGVEDVAVHRDPPPFRPVMIRAMANLAHDPDWMTRHLGSNLEKGTLEAVARGRVSDTAGTSFVPAAADRLNFGRHGLTRGWDPADLEPIDRDSDGRVLEGTPGERPARPKAASVLDVI